MQFGQFEGKKSVLSTGKIRDKGKEMEASVGKKVRQDTVRKVIGRKTKR